MVPLWSQLVARVRADRSLESLPDEIQQGKTEMLSLVPGTDIEARTLTSSPRPPMSGSR